MSANPYERRQPGRVRDEMMLANTSLGFARASRESALTIEDLEAIAHNATFRGVQRAEQEHREREQAARREAWEEGRAFGDANGRLELLSEIDRRHGALVRKMYDAGMSMAMKVGKDKHAVSKDELERMLDALCDTLAGLMSDHHSGFAKDSP